MNAMPLRKTTEVAAKEHHPAASLIQDAGHSSSLAVPTAIAFITNFCPHYRVQTFQMLAEKYKTFFYFYSQGTEWYWLKENGVRNGQFLGEYLGGAKNGIALTLFTKLWKAPCDVYIKCINGRVALPLTYLVARLRRKPFILWTGIWQTLETSFHRLVHPLTRFVYRHSDAIVVYGDHVKAYLVGQGVEPQRVFVAHHAIDNGSYSRHVSQDEREELRGQFQLKEGMRILLYVGRMENEKGIPFLLRAFAASAFEDAVLLLVGEGKEKESLILLAKDLGIADKVRFIGYIPPERTVTLYSLSYALVLPSISTQRGREPWGLVVNEAMNQGLPVITTDAVGAAAGGLVIHKVNGLVVPEKDVEKLGEALAILLDFPKMRAEMSQAARQSMRDWDNRKMVDGFCRAIDFVCSVRGKSRKT